MVARARVRAERAVVHGAGGRRRRAHPRRPRAGRHPRHPADPPAARRPARRARRRAGVGARHHPAGRHGARPRRRRRRATAGRRGPARRHRSAPVTADGAPARRTGSSRSRSIPTDGTFADRRPRRSRAARRRRRRRRHLQLVPARPRRRGRHARSRCRRASSRPDRCAPGSRSARTYDLPTHAADGTRAGARQVEVLTTLELRAGDDLVRVHVELDNHGVRDHRLRVVLPLPERARSSVAECAFATVERGLVAEGGPTEQGLATYPSRRFVTAGGLTVAHEGLLEYELVDLDDAAATAGALALTLLRCTGMLSQGPMATRPLPAGPLTAMEGPQSQHRVEARLRRPPRRTRSLRGGRRPVPPAAGHAGRRGVGDRRAHRPGAVDQRRRGERDRPRGRASSSCGCSTRPPRPTTVTIDGRGRLAARSARSPRATLRGLVRSEALADRHCQPR